MNSYHFRPDPHPVISAIRALRVSQIIMGQIGICCIHTYSCLVCLGFSSHVHFPCAQMSPAACMPLFQPCCLPAVSSHQWNNILLVYIYYSYILTGSTEQQARAVCSVLVAADPGLSSNRVTNRLSTLLASFGGHTLSHTGCCYSPWLRTHLQHTYAVSGWPLRALQHHIDLGTLLLPVIMLQNELRDLQPSTAEPLLTTGLWLT